MNSQCKHPLEGIDSCQMANDYELYYYGSQFSSDVFFKIDIANETVTFLGNNLKVFKNHEIVPNFLTMLHNTDIIHAEDKIAFFAAIDGLKDGIVTPLKFRLKYHENEIVWYNAQYTIVNDENGVPAAAIGKINNIQETFELTHKASLDTLTSCLNKGTFEAYAKSLMQKNVDMPENGHVFIIIDIDNFKAVNDNLGHFFGDIVLKEVAKKLRRIFRETDYIGRIGGDEFAVIMKNVDDGKIVIKKVNEVLEALETTYEGKSKSYPISSSIGIAMYPQHGDNYDDIYINADAALYKSKFDGKNTYTIYDEIIAKGTMANPTPFDMANRALSNHFDQEVAMDAFNLLFENENYEVSLMSVMRHLGEHYNVDRCYIFELKPNSTEIYDNTYEWCRDGIEPQIDFLQDIHVSVFQELFSAANEEGVYYCNDLNEVKHQETHDTLAVQGIKSFLHMFIKKNDIVHYAIGFDDCTSERIWTPREISTLMYSSKIIAQFLFYNSALNVERTQSSENLKVIDALNFYAYIVDTDTRELLYINDVTRALVPEAQIGRKCHYVLRGNEEECEDCPMRALRENPDKSKVRMIIHNDKLNLDVLVTASKLHDKDGHARVFVSSTDIKELIVGLKEGHELSDIIVFD